MQMNMTFIGMDCEIVLVLIFKVFFAHFLADLHSSFGSNLPRLERHNEVLGNDGASACTCCCNFSKFFGSLAGFTTAHKGADQSAVVGLGSGSNVGYC